MINGNFETSGVSSFAPLPGTLLPGWTAVPTKGIGGQLVNKSAGGASGITGDQFVEFSALTGDCLTLSQSVAGLLPGRCYDLTFDYGNPYTFPFPWDITAVVSGTPPIPPFSDSGSGLGPDMRHGKISFIASATTQTITFTSSGLSNLGVALDNVCLVPCEPCVPVTLPLVPGLNQISLPGRNPCVFQNLPASVTPGGVITFAGASMIASAYPGYVIEISNGPNLGQCSVVVSNTVTSIATTPAFALKVTPTSLLCIRKPVTLSQIIGALPFSDILTVKPVSTGGSTHDYSWDGTDWYETTTSAAANDVVLDPCTPFCINAQTPHSITMNLCQPDYDCCCPGVLVRLENVLCASSLPSGYQFDLVIINATPATFTSLVFSPSAGVLPSGGVTGTIPTHFFGTPLPPGAMARIPLHLAAPVNLNAGVLCFDITPWNGNHEGCSIRVCAPSPPCPVFPPGGLPGPCPCNNAWLIDTWSNPAFGPITSIYQAAYLLSAPGTLHIATRSDNVLNHRAPDIAPCSTVPFCNPLTIPGDTPGDTARLIISAKTTITVSPANAGTWTFGLRSGAGYAFRLLNSSGVPMPWITVVGIGNALDLGKLAVFYDFSICDSNAHAWINLPAGDYCAEFLCYENDGPSFFQVYAAKGTYTTAGATNDFRLVGYAGSQRCWPCLQGNWTVATSQRGGSAIGSFTDAEADLNATGVLHPPAAELNFLDPQNPGTSSIGGDLPYPGNLPGDDDNFALKAWSTLCIPCDSYVLIGFQSDDATRIRIDGWTGLASLYGLRSFTDNGGGSAAGSNSVLPSGKSRAEFSGQGRVTAVVRLKAGYYNIEVLHWEGTLGASLEVFAAPYNSAYNYTCPRLLSSALCALGKDTSGIPLCDTPWHYSSWAASYPLPGGAGSAVANPLADADGDGSNNRAEYTFGSNPLDPLDKPNLAYSFEDYVQAGEVTPAFTLTLVRPSNRETHAAVNWSESLSNWQTAELTASEPLPGDLVQETFRVPIPLPPGPYHRPRAFMDVKAE